MGPQRMARIYERRLRRVRGRRTGSNKLVTFAVSEEGEEEYELDSDTILQHLDGDGILHEVLHALLRMSDDMCIFEVTWNDGNGDVSIDTLGVLGLVVDSSDEPLLIAYHTHDRIRRHRN